MKVEIKMNEQENSLTPETQSSEILAPTCDVAIDIGQILAANQALLKNMARKMDRLEKKLENMEKAYAEQAVMLEHERSKTLVLLEGPRQEFKPWQPKEQELDQTYFNRFSYFDKVFRPWVMRRNQEN